MTIAPVGADIQSFMSRVAQVQAMFAPVSSSTATATSAGSASSADQFSAALTAATGSTTTTSASLGSISSDVVAGSSGVSSSSSAMPVSADGTVTGADVVAEAEKFIGTPYVLGGESSKGIDCSGLMQRAYGDLGITIPRGVHGQMTIGTEVPSLKDAKPGDLIVTNGGDHVVMYVGDGKIIQAPYPGRTVQVKELWVGDEGITTIRRVLPDTVSGLTAKAQRAAFSQAATS